jgi:hypothetical protein
MINWDILFTLVFFVVFCCFCFFLVTNMYGCLFDNRFIIIIKQWVYLIFKENILIATLIKRVNKNVDIKFSAHERFWKVAQNQKIGKPNNLTVLGVFYGYWCYVGVSLHLVEILGVLFLWCGFWCSRGCCLVILRWIRTDTVGDVGFLLCVSCDLSIAPHWCEICFVCT